jgi:hypothetical protein
MKKLAMEPRIRAMAMFNYLVERHSMPPTYKEQVKNFIANNKKKTPAARMGYVYLCPHSRICSPGRGTPHRRPCRRHARCGSAAASAASSIEPPEGGRILFSSDAAALAAAASPPPPPRCCLCLAAAAAASALPQPWLPQPRSLSCPDLGNHRGHLTKHWAARRRRTADGAASARQPRQ